MQPCSFGTSWWDGGFAHGLPKGLCHHAVGLCDKVSSLHSRGSYDKEITGSTPRLCRYNQNPQLLMGLMKGQLPGKRLCERGLAALVDTSLNLHLKYAFMAKKNNSLQANCCQKVELREAFLLLYSALVRQFWTDGSSCGLPRAKNTRPYRSELREGPQRQLKGWCPSIMRQLGLFSLEKAQGESYQFVQILDEGE